MRKHLGVVINSQTTAWPRMSPCGPCLARVEWDLQEPGGRMAERWAGGHETPPGLQNCRDTFLFHLWNTQIYSLIILPHGCVHTRCCDFTALPSVHKTAQGAQAASSVCHRRWIHSQIVLLTHSAAEGRLFGWKQQRGWGECPCDGHIPTPGSTMETPLMLH